ncbi:MAG: hypothetical protein ABSA78_03940 [Candidatus Sulfotelmatobacter sp.]|jgi:hypothetical protein
MTVDWITVAVSAAINTPAVGGLLGFLGKRVLQREAQKHSQELERLKAGYIAELEKYKSELDRSKLFLQAEIDKTILVTRVHFQTEFEALKEVFGKLADLKFKICCLHPVMRIASADETKEDRLRLLNRQVEAFHIAYDALLEASEHLCPFYPKDLYDLLRQCLRVADSEDKHLRLSGPETFTISWSQGGEANVTDFLASYDAVATLIRERISKLAIVRH